jgi:hypothetical protein
MRLYPPFMTDKFKVAPYESPTQVPLNKNISQDPLNTSIEVTTPVYKGGRRRRKKSNKSVKRKTQRRKVRRNKTRKQRGGFSLPSFITDFTRGIQYGTEKLISQYTTQPLSQNRNPDMAAQPFLRSS